MTVQTPGIEHLVVTEPEPGIALVELARGKVNAIDTQMYDEIAEVFDVLSDNQDIRAIVLTGAGRAFCSGADLSTDPFASPQPGFSSSPVDPPAFRLGTFVVAAVNGHAIGIGLTLTLIHLVSIPISNTSVNPARSIASAVYGGAAPLEQLWVFIVAPIIGGVVAGAIVRLARRRELA